MDGLLLKEKTLEQLKLKGPQLPVHIAAQLKINLTFAGAFLSELIAEGKAKYTTLKIGGSPLYYVSGHEARLQSFSKHLGQREKEAYELLMQEKLLKDETLIPVLRVAMRAIRDYAIPLRITTEKEAAIYWKWYLLPEDEMHLLLDNMLSNEMPETQQVTVPEHLPDSLPTQTAIPEEKKESRKAVVAASHSEAKPAPKMEKNIMLMEEIHAEKPSEPIFQTADVFAQGLFSYFAANGINIASHNILKKNAEVECVVRLPTPLGEISYHCLAKKKKRCSDADISAGYIRAAAQRLPYLFISTSALPKKVQDFVAAHMPNTLVKILDGNKNL